MSAATSTTQPLPPRVPTARRLPSNTKWTQSPLGVLVHKHGWSLPRLAEATGYAENLLRLVFVGRRLPTVELLLRLHDALGLPADTLLRAARVTLARHLAER